MGNGVSINQLESHLWEAANILRCIEEAGTGTLDMIALCKEAGLPPPDFRQDGGQFVQTLWRPTAQVTTQVTAQVGGEVTGEVATGGAAVTQSSGPVGTSHGTSHGISPSYPRTPLGSR
jgi:hypothetical protein